MRIKVTYNKETKKILPPKDYEALLQYAKKAFQGIPEKIQFYYQDQEGDIISIGNNDEWQFELQQFVQENKGQIDSFKLLIAENPQEASKFFENNNLQDTVRQSQQHFDQNQNNQQFQQSSKIMESSLNYYNVQKEPMPSVQKEDFITPLDLPQRQGSIASQTQIANQLGKNQEQYSISNSQNPLLMSKVNAFNQGLLDQQQQERDSIANQNNFFSGQKQGYANPSNNNDVSNFYFEEVKSELDEADKLGVSEMYENQDILNQLNQDQLQGVDIGQKQQPIQEEEHKNQQQEEEPDQEVRYIDDMDDDDRFDQNFNQLDGRVKRSSTKMVRIDNDFSRGGTFLSRNDTVTSIKRVDTIVKVSDQDQDHQELQESPEQIQEQQQQPVEIIREKSEIIEEEEIIYEQPEEEQKESQIDILAENNIDECHEAQLQKLHTIPELKEEQSQKFEQEVVQIQNEDQPEVIIENHDNVEVDFLKDLSNRILEQNGIDASQSFVCFKCQGSKLNKKQKKCRKCDGTGQLGSEFMDEIKKILKEEMQAYLPLVLSKVFLDQNNASLMMSQINIPEINGKLNAAAQEHHGIKCSKCGSCPIVGARFKCYVCHDLELCEVCEITDDHPNHHSMIKIRNPNCEPFNKKDLPQVEEKEIIQEQIVQLEQPVQLQSQEEEKKTEQLLGSQIDFNPINISKPKKVKKDYQAKFVKESFGNNYTVEAGVSFFKTWTFRNDGKDSWPVDTKFVFSNGAIFGEEAKPIEREVNPGDYIEVQILFIAPKNVGKYCSYYRFGYGKNKRFGQKVWCDISVAEAEDDLARLTREMNSFNHPSAINHSEQPHQISSLDQSLILGQQNVYQQQQHQQIVNPIVPDVSLSQIQHPFDQFQQQQQQQLGYPYNQYYSNQQIPPVNYNQYNSNNYNYQQQQQLGYQQQQQQQPIYQSQVMQPGFGQQQQQPLNVGGQQYQQLPVPKREDSISQEELNKIDYVSKVESILSKSNKTTMLTLLDMGFTDFKKNEELVRKHNGDISLVVTALYN